MRPSWLIRRNKGEETSESQALSWHKGGPGENKGVEPDRVFSCVGGEAITEDLADQFYNQS